MAVVTTSDGVEIAVHDLGGNGPPLLLSHATGFHGRMWQPAASRLAPHFRCLAVDHRGHGASSAPPGRDYDWTGFARDLLAIVDALGHDAVLAAGHSSGGTAVLLAEEGRPGTFSALYCFEPVLVPSDTPLGVDPDNWSASRARHRRDRFGSRAEAQRHFSGRPPFERFSPAVLEAYVAFGLQDLVDGSLRLSCRPEDEARLFEMATAHACFPGLGRVGCPVTLARGEQTDAFPPTTARAALARLPHAEGDVVAGVDHFGPLQDPGAVASSILASFAPFAAPFP